MKIESPIYLAASYSRRLEMLEYAGQLAALGYQVNAEWVTEGHDIPIDASPERILALQQRFCLQDFHEIWIARTVINFTETPAYQSQARHRGGRHVELGMALAISGSNGMAAKTIVLIGPCENIFHTLSVIKHFDTWEAFLAAIADQTNIEK